CILRMRDLTFVAANPAFERASGRSVADLVGRRPDEIGLIDPADAATLHREVAALDEGDLTDLVTRIRYRLPEGRGGVARMAIADRRTASSGARPAWRRRSGTPTRSIRPSTPHRTNGRPRSAAASRGW